MPERRSSVGTLLGPATPRRLRRARGSPAATLLIACPPVAADGGGCWSVPRPRRALHGNEGRTDRGARSRNRTCGLRFRKPLLYPTELCERHSPRRGGRNLARSGATVHGGVGRSAAQDTLVDSGVSVGETAEDHALGPRVVGERVPHGLDGDPRRVLARKTVGPGRDHHRPRRPRTAQR